MASTAFDAAAAEYRAGRYEQAVALARQSLIAEPDDDRFWIVIAMAAHKLGRFEEAATAFRQLTELKPASAEHWSNLGYMLRLAGQQQEAEAAFVEALRIAPGAYGTLLNYGLLLMDAEPLRRGAPSFPGRRGSRSVPIRARIYAASACFECGDIVRAEQLLPPPANGRRWMQKRGTTWAWR